MLFSHDFSLSRKADRYRFMGVHSSKPVIVPSGEIVVPSVFEHAAPRTRTPQGRQIVLGNAKQSLADGTGSAQPKGTVDRDALRQAAASLSSQLSTINHLVRTRLLGGVGGGSNPPADPIRQRHPLLTYAFNHAIRPWFSLAGALNHGVQTAR